MYPAIALEQLVKMIGEPQQEKVIKVLDSYTMKKLHYTDIDAWYPISLSPKEKLLSILQNDENIKTNFLSWIEDIVNYQKEATEFMSKSYLEVKERTKMKNGN